MYCKNCGKDIGDSEKDICVECEANMNTTVAHEDNVEVVREVNQNSNNGGNYNNTNNSNTNTNTQQNTNYYNNDNAGRKSKIAAGILGILLGAFGVHNFYLGYNGKAIAQLLITVLTCGIGAPVSSIWGLIEGILILTGSINTDANGVPLGD